MSDQRTLPDLGDASRSELLLRAAKVRTLQAARLLRWLGEPAAFPKPLVSPRSQDFEHLLYEQQISLVRTDDTAHPVFEAGKRANLALAAPRFDGVVVQASRPLSFWRTLGRVTAAAGYRAGMELRGGCIVPSLGGGLCLLSNALFVMAVRLGWTILERHGHTLEAVPPDPKELWGLDATVFHPYVDLRIAPAMGRARLEVRVDGDTLCLYVHGDRPQALRVELHEEHAYETETSEGRWRMNRIRRRTYDASNGTLFGDDIVAHNRKRLLNHGAQHRNCLTCQETNCHARPGLLKVLR